MLCYWLVGELQGIFGEYKLFKTNIGQSKGAPFSKSYGKESIY